MGIFNIYKQSRYTLNPTHLTFPFFSIYKTLPYQSPNLSSISSSGYLSFHHLFHSISSNSYILSKNSHGSASFYGVINNICVPSVCFLSCNTKIRPFCSYGNSGISSSIVSDVGVGDDDDDEKKIVSLDVITKMVDVIKDDGKDMELNLDLVGSNLSRWAILEILRGLNVAKVPALRFFKWLRNVNPLHCRNADICSLMVNNCGLLRDDATMHWLLKDFAENRICLTSNAFGYLPILMPKKVAEGSIRGVIDVLNEIGGSCRNSGIHSLLQLVCSHNSYDLARFVMEITEKKASYYSVLLGSLCAKHKFDEARNVLEEMWRNGCSPETKAYNYLISSLCKFGGFDEALSVLQEMINRGCPPEALTFEILIYFACRYGRSDDAFKLCDQMISRGIQVRHLTHRAFIRGFFKSRQFKEAYRYVTETTARYEPSVQVVAYNDVANLHLKHGNLVAAHNILVEMIEKGFRPKHSLYVKASSRLLKDRKPQFAKNLKDRFSNLMQKIRESAR